MLLPVSAGQGMEEAEVGWGHEAAVLQVEEAGPDQAEAGLAVAGEKSPFD